MALWNLTIPSLTHRVKACEKSFLRMRPYSSGSELNMFAEYTMAAEERLYNPRSVVMALSNNNLGNYWTSSGSCDEIFYYIENNVAEVRDDLALMVSQGKGCRLKSANMPLQRRT